MKPFSFVGHTENESKQNVNNAIEMPQADVDKNARTEKLLANQNIYKSTEREQVVKKLCWPLIK